MRKLSWVVAIGTAAGLALVMSLAAQPAAADQPGPSMGPALSGLSTGGMYASCTTSPVGQPCRDTYGRVCRGVTLGLATGSTWLWQCTLGSGGSAVQRYGALPPRGYRQPVMPAPLEPWSRRYFDPWEPLW